MIPRGILDLTAVDLVEDTTDTTDPGLLEPSDESAGRGVALYGRSSRTVVRTTESSNPVNRS